MPRRREPEPKGQSGAATADLRIDTDLLERWALRYLERYASSAENLRRVLRRKVLRRAGSDAEVAARSAIDELIARYRSAGLLDDATYAAARAHSELGRGRPLRRIAAGLAARGVAADESAAALRSLRDAEGEPDLIAAGEFARRRRLGPFRTRPTEHARELAAFARAGFARREAEAVLACPDPAALAALVAER